MDNETEREACRLRELFRGRFNQDSAIQLIEDLGGIMEAIDFVMHENPETVSRSLKQTPEYLQCMRDESAKLATILENKIEDSVRQFACGDCKRSWWKRVPMRKEVSKCRRCKVAYDPIPTEYESGTGKFLCVCGNEFTGFATMNETISECYECGAQVPVDHMVPPRRDRTRKTTAPHSCNGSNCYNKDHSHHHLPDIVEPYTGDMGNFGGGHYQGGVGSGRGRGIGTSRGGWTGGSSRKNMSGNQFDDPTTSGRTSRGGYNPTPAEPPSCVHPKSQKRPMKVVSKRHISTGSTVSSFLSQGSIDTQSVSIMSDLYSIKE